MTAAIKWNLVPIEDYLAGELDSPVRHEYVGGAVYAMAGARVTHNRISGNAFGSLHARLRGGACHPFGPDMKVRVRLEKETRFYYPDLSVVCESNPPDDLYQDAPTVVLEVVSPSTRRVDEEEKKEAYLTIASLGAYLIVEQEAPAVLVYRRGAEGGFTREIHEGLDAIVPLPEVGVELPLAELYEGVEFSAESPDA